MPLVGKLPSSPWLWMTLACLLLGISGGIREWRDWQFNALAEESSHPLFSLNELPRTFIQTKDNKVLRWESAASEDNQLDPDVSRIAGAADSIIRTYVDNNDSKITMLALYGLAVKVHGHSPDFCYPAIGYKLVKESEDHVVTVPGMKEPVRYRWSVYVTRTNGVSRYVETYHTFFYNGAWLPETKGLFKSFRYHPSMFRVLLDRPVSSLSNGVDSTSEALLGNIAKEISSRISHKIEDATDATPTSVSPATTSGSPKPTDGGAH